jgi:hypothetical protein
MASALDTQHCRDHRDRWRFYARMAGAATLPRLYGLQENV